MACNCWVLEGIHTVDMLRINTRDLMILWSASVYVSLLTTAPWAAGPAGNMEWRPTAWFGAGLRGTATGEGGGEGWGGGGGGGAKSWWRSFLSHRVCCCNGEGYEGHATTQQSNCTPSIGATGQVLEALCAILCITAGWLRLFLHAHVYMNVHMYVSVHVLQCNIWGLTVTSKIIIILISTVTSMGIFSQKETLLLRKAALLCELLPMQPYSYSCCCADWAAVPPLRRAGASLCPWEVSSPVCGAAVWVPCTPRDPAWSWPEWWGELWPTLTGLPNRCGCHWLGLVYCVCIMDLP